LVGEKLCLKIKDHANSACLWKLERATGIFSSYTSTENSNLPTEKRHTPV